MTPPPRPAKVTAAGVLLVVVGSNVLLVSLGMVGVLIWAAVGLAFVPCVAAAVVAGWVPVSVGGLILAHGSAVLRGTMPTTRNAAAGYLALGTIGGVLFGMAVVFGVCGVGRLPLRDLDPTVIGAFAFAVLNIAAVLVAGIFLGHSTEQYEAWRLAKATPPPAELEEEQPDDLPEA